MVLVLDLSSIQPAPFHERLDELISDALLQSDLGSSDLELRAVDEHASLGCSLCARAVVNARELSAELSVSLAPRSPSASLRAKILSSARARAASRNASGPRPEADKNQNNNKNKDPRHRDPSAIVAHMHLADPSEIDRSREVAAIDAHLGEGSPRLAGILAEVQRLIDFPLLFISLFRGVRVGYLAERGLPDILRGMGGMRREMTFCTHCVSTGRPLVVGDASSEPFFRGNPSVQRFGVKAYVGVPLRTSRGVTVGTLCGLDYVPRSIPPATVRVLERFAEQILAAIDPESPPSPESARSPEA